MESMLNMLRSCGLLDPGVLAAGIERRWASRADVAGYAAEALSTGNDRPEVVLLTMAEELDPERLIDLLRRWAHLGGLPSERAEDAVRRWMFAALTAISRSDISPKEKLDRLEEAYAIFDYPEDMRECSRYYVPPQDRARGIRVGELTASPLEAMNRLLSQLGKEFGIV